MIAADVNAADRLLTRQEAAAYLRLSVKTLEAWAQRNRGPRFVKQGRRVTYRLRDLQDWIERNLSA